MTPLEHVHTLRLEETRHRLETEEEPVVAIALAVGYEDAAFFGRLFRRRVNLPTGPVPPPLRGGAAAGAAEVGAEGAP